MSWRFFELHVLNKDPCRSFLTAARSLPERLYVDHLTKWKITKVELKSPPAIPLPNGTQWIYELPATFREFQLSFRLKVYEGARKRGPTFKVMLVTGLTGERLSPIWSNEEGAHTRTRDSITGCFYTPHSVTLYHTPAFQTFSLKRLMCVPDFPKGEIVVTHETFFHGNMEGLLKNHPEFREAAETARERSACRSMCTHCHYHYRRKEQWNIFVPPRCPSGWGIQREHEAGSEREWWRQGDVWVKDPAHAAFYNERTQAEIAFRTLVRAGNK